MVMCERGLTLCTVVKLHGDIDQTLGNSLHGLLHCEIGGLDCCDITEEYIARVLRIHM